jgi:predicted ArsR family transcriptional regulator
MIDPRTSTTDDDLAAVCSLGEPVRRALYEYVAAQPGDVSRNEAAEALGIQRPLAAFHLDRLVEAGLLEAAFRRLTGRSGPGAGRPAKVYRRSASERAVSLPPRQYDLAAELMAEALENAGDRPARGSLRRVARAFGRRVGEEVRAGLSSRAGRQRRMTAVAEALGRYGYEPRPDGAALRLGNCPFHALSQRHRDLVCGMNLSLLEGLVEALGESDLEARRDHGNCCVTVAAKAKKG